MNTDYDKKAAINTHRIH